MANKEKCPECGLDMANCTCDEETEFLTLEFEDGEEIECEIMGIFDCGGKEYIALLPEDGSDDVFVYGYKEINDEEYELIDIEDDKEFERVVAEFDKIIDETDEEVDD